MVNALPFPPNIYAIDLQIRRFCSDKKRKEISTHWVQNDREHCVHDSRAATPVCLNTSFLCFLSVTAPSPDQTCPCVEWRHRGRCWILQFVCFFLIKTLFCLSRTFERFFFSPSDARRHVCFCFYKSVPSFHFFSRALAVCPRLKPTLSG